MHPSFYDKIDLGVLRIIPQNNFSYFNEGEKFEICLPVKSGEDIQFYNYHWSLSFWLSALAQNHFVIESFDEPSSIQCSQELSSAFDHFDDLQRRFEMLFDF